MKIVSKEKSKSGPPKGSRNNPNGRPKRELSAQDKLKILKLAAACCSKDGMQVYLDLCNDTFYRLFDDPDVKGYFDKGVELRNTMLRMKQMEMAMKGNIQMLIHLGKQYLDQTDKAHVTNDVNNNVRIVDDKTLKELAQALIDERD